MYCTQCGTNNSDSASFCSQCGSRMSGTTPPEPMMQTPSVQDLPPPAMRTNAFVPNYMIWSVLATLLCCLPTGIVAIVYSAQVDTKLRLKEYEAAKQASKNARTWCLVSVGVGIVVSLIFLGSTIAAISRAQWN